MAFEIAIAEQKLKTLKEKKETLEKVVGKQQVDIIKAKSKLSKKQSQRQEKAAIVEEARKSLEEVQATRGEVAKQQEEQKLAVKAFLT